MIGGWARRYPFERGEVIASMLVTSPGEPLSSLAKELRKGH
jgi:hypothetical protein